MGCHGVRVVRIGLNPSFLTISMPWYDNEYGSDLLKFVKYFSYRWNEGCSNGMIT